MSEILEFLENMEEGFEVPSLRGTSQENNHNLEEWLDA